MIEREYRRCRNILTRRKASLVLANEKQSPLFIRVDLVLQIEVLMRKLEALEAIRAQRIMVISTAQFTIYHLPDGRLVPFSQTGGAWFEKHAQLMDPGTRWATWTPAEMLEAVGGLAGIESYKVLP